MCVYEVETEKISVWGEKVSEGFIAQESEFRDITLRKIKKGGA